jgi:two-component system cell cycle response regulator DivK
MNRQEQKILIIDDDERNIFALKAVLTAKKFNCVAASGGLQALDIVKQHRDITIALVDMMMPDMDGYEFMTLVRKIPSLSALQLVALTAQAMVGDKEKCLAAGANAYISKPVDIDILLEILDGRLKQAQ